jgi:excinuclease UvrABC nuclease subunit
MESKYFKKNKLPEKPGVYFFKYKGQILYIGKATSLRDRTKSYFAKDLIETRGPLIVDMVFKASKLKWQETDSVLEALILEADLIKKHQPYYNTREKDDKSFLSVVITREKLPRVFTVRTRNLEGHSNIWKGVRISKIYGPFTSGPQLREAMKIIRRIFPFLDDKSKNYLEFYKQINLVPDLSDLSAQTGHKLYKQNIKNIILFFSGKKKQILKNLKKEMNEYSKLREFEKAGEIKRQVFALKHINDIALLRNEGRGVSEGTLGRSDGDGQRKFSVENFRGESGNISSVIMRIEAYDIAHMGGKNMVGVMTVVENGEAIKSEYKKFKIRTQNNANDTGALKEVLERRLAHPEWPYPSLIVVDGGVAQINAAKAVLNRLGINIPLVSVLKDEHHNPKNILGDKNLGHKYEREILFSNSEAHRFAIAYHKNMRNKNFLK